MDAPHSSSCPDLRLDSRPGALPGFAVAVLALAAVPIVLAVEYHGALALGVNLPRGIPEQGLPAGQYAAIAALTSTGLLIVSGLTLAFLRGPVRWGWRRGDHWRVGTGAVAVVAVNLLGTRVMEWVGETYRGLPVPTGAAGAGLAFALVALALAPFAEELFFREVLLARALGRWPRAPAVALTAVAFGLLHLEAGGLVLAATLVGMGVILGWLRLRSGSTGAVIVVHAFNNAFALAMQQFTGS